MVFDQAALLHVAEYNMSSLLPSPPSSFPFVFSSFSITKYWYNGTSKQLLWPPQRAADPAHTWTKLLDGDLSVMGVWPFASSVLRACYEQNNTPTAVYRYLQQYI